MVGATAPDQMKIIRRLAPKLPFLVPGVGAQGGSVRDGLAGGRDDNGRGLIINSSRFMSFSSNHIQTSYASHILCFFLAWRISSKHDIHSSSCHVRGYRHSPQSACLGNNIGFLFMKLRVQDLVFDAPLR